MRHETIVTQSTRALIVAAATRVWAADPSASLERVAAEAGVGRATVHRQFPARADLMRAAALDGIASLTEALDRAGIVDGSHADDLARLIGILVRAGDRLHFTLLAGEILNDPIVLEAEAAVDVRLRSVLDGIVQAGALRADIPHIWRFRALEALVYAAWTAVADGDLAPNDAPGLVLNSFLLGLGA